MDQQPVNFFFNGRETLHFERNRCPEIERRFQLHLQGKLILFNNIEAHLGINYDWITNPDNGFRYDASKHWTAVPDYSAIAGDIKYVWEKSRFSFLYDIIRYDYHYNIDCAAIVFAEIISWIKANPINCGPNYRCSQEISLRVLNWTFALHYYKNSAVLTDELFDKMQFAIYWQMDHVYKNIDFSRIAVRNNHAITETLALYLVGTLYPGFPEAARWKTKGKKWFEEEVAYQVYEDGTFLQFSMNYHRVVIQLLTWGLILSEKNGDRFKEVVYDRAKKSVHFLRVCMNDFDGYLPNYGANDGALFFKLNNAKYRDYRPQLQALANAIGMDLQFQEDCEDAYWYGVKKKSLAVFEPADGLHPFKQGGYYIIRESDTLTFIKCGSYKDRPSQADNLHIDVWYKGENVLIDGGSYKYNTDEQTLRYFMGTASHNTVMLDEADQMKKGARFIWYNWTQSREISFVESETAYHFTGTVAAFKHMGPSILHKREITKQKSGPCWTVKDKIEAKPVTVLMKQLWHLPDGYTTIEWHSADEKGMPITAEIATGSVSELYGSKKDCQVIVYPTYTSEVGTKFSIK